MQAKKVIVASDHAGCALRQKLVDALKNEGVDVINYGANSAETPVDYPEKAAAVAAGIRRHEANHAILICGTGIGMSIAVNRYPFIRGALVFNEEMASLARRHNNANVLIFGGRMLDFETALACAKTFLTTDFDGGRHTARVNRLERMPDV